MDNKNLNSVLSKVYKCDLPEREDIEYLLDLQDPDQIETLFAFADKVRHDFAGDGILLRAIIEFSSYCKNTCFYCGLNKNNKSLERYRLSKEKILDAVGDIAAAGIKTVVLQSGEDDMLDPYWLKDLIKQIKASYDMAITLSVGQKSYDDYLLWKKAGADRYLLKIETANEKLYNALHKDMSFADRLRCTRDLKAIGYQNGSGCLVGLKGQTIATLAEDILFFKKEEFEMIGIGLFIPHENTPLADQATGSLMLALKVLAVTRIVTKFAHLPATTAIATAGGDEHRIKALKAGANVIMPNFTPAAYRKLYEIYPGKKCIYEDYKQCIDSLEKNAKAANRWLDFSRGDSLKKTNRLEK